MSKEIVMQPLRMILPAALAAALAACASTGASHPTYGEQMRTLSEECRARGGILVPLPGPQTGRAEADHACQISGGATRIERN
jgi:hypothetical protein